MNEKITGSCRYCLAWWIAPRGLKINFCYKCGKLANFPDAEGEQPFELSQEKKQNLKKLTRLLRDLTQDLKEIVKPFVEGDKLAAPTENLFPGPKGKDTDWDKELKQLRKGK